MREVNEALRKLSKPGASASVQDRARWDELQAEKTQCEKELSSLSEASRQLGRLEVEHLETILSNDNTNQTIQNALKKPDCEPMTISDLRNFVNKLPHLIFELSTRLLVVQIQQEAIYPVVKDLEEQLRTERKVDECCLQTLEEVTKKVTEKSTIVFKNIRGADEADQVIVSNFNQLLHVEDISTGRKARLWGGQLSVESLQVLNAGARSRNSDTMTQAPVPQERRYKIVGWFLAGLLVNIAFASWLRSVSV